ncbi:MAG TPA: DUF805 domain-containing protein [Rhizomicrobium sp.]|nr:DUF805 domain-containing protein [Rhizomicrobium sp.]
MTIIHRIFHRRTNRATFWASMVILALALVLFRWLEAPAGIAAALGLLVIAVPRLHDLGYSGWWAGGVLLALTGALLAATFHSEMVATHAAGGIILLLVTAALWLGIMPGEKTANRWGNTP